VNGDGAALAVGGRRAPGDPAASMLGLLRTRHVEPLEDLAQRDV